MVLEFPQEKPASGDLHKLLDHIQTVRHLDLNSYRSNFMLRRLNTRLHYLKIEDCNAYISFIKKNPDEINRFLDALSINVTEFFRDPEVFEEIKTKVIPELIRRKDETNNKLIRVWSVPCASGEEPYSIAMLFHEALASRADFRVNILGTDVDAEALDKARNAVYKKTELAKLDKEILDKNFISAYNGEELRVKDEIQKLVAFKKHDLLNEGPAKFMDIVLCRNLLIYLNRDQQNDLFVKFSQALNKEGLLILGKVETIWTRDLFTPVSSNNKIYRKATNQTSVSNSNV